MQVTKMLITAEVYNGQMTVHFRSRDVAQRENVEMALDEIYEVAEESEVRLLVINFTHVQFLSSLFLGKLTALYKRLSVRGIQLRLCCMSPEAENVYKIMNLQKLAAVYPTEEAALKEASATKAPEPPRAPSSGRTWEPQVKLPPLKSKPGQEDRP